MSKMPVIFTGHGNPMNAIGKNRAREGWKKTGLEIGKPKVIIAVSAHWMTRGQAVRTAADNPQINDMYGFPDELYQVHYEPAGSPEYAKKVLNLLGDSASEDNTWGIDHGVWTVLSNMYPDADVPVVMVSTNVKARPEEIFELGQKIAPLREEGALILASGNVVHNLRMVDWSNPDGADWADEFDEVIRNAIVSGDFRTPVNFKDLTNYKLAIPSVDHYYPLLAALGAASPEDEVTVWNEYRELGSMSMTSYTFR